MIADCTLSKFQKYLSYFVKNCHGNAATDDVAKRVHVYVRQRETEHVVFAWMPCVRGEQQGRGSSRRLTHAVTSIRPQHYTHSSTTTLAHSHAPLNSVYVLLQLRRTIQQGKKQKNKWEFSKIWLEFISHISSVIIMTMCHNRGVTVTLVGKVKSPAVWCRCQIVAPWD